MTTKRSNVRGLDPEAGVEGDGVVIGPDGQFTIGPVGAGAGTYVEADGVPRLSGGSAEPVDPVVGQLRYNTSVDVPVPPASEVTVDDGAFANIVGLDVQTALDSIDDQLGVGGTPTTALVPLTTVIGGVPELVWDEDNNLVMTEVPL